MKKKTPKKTKTKHCFMIMLGIILIIVGAIGTILTDGFKEFLIFSVISIVGIIIFEFTQLEINKRDRLD